ncbi:MAG TPA: beta-galactosidase, partial [Clostridia bacterium]|nr:beta-galactosidase [Clostridia bacterium]
MSDIKTIWYNEAKSEIPLNEYPRPQLKRDCWQCLNGYYEYAITNKNADDMGEKDGDILVPFAIESALSGVKRQISHNERLWYRKKFTVNNELKDKNIILHFEAVDWHCVVFLNGMPVGAHTGGYDAFSFDITKYLK